MIPTFNRLAFLSVLVLTPDATAQFNLVRGRGLASAAAAGLSLKSPSGSVSPDPFLIGTTSANQASPILLGELIQAPGVPSLAQTAMFENAAGLVEVSAMSTGNDVMPRVTSVGELALLAGSRWMGLVVSVDNEAIGLDGSLTERRRLGEFGARVSPGADLISYYFASSTGIASSVAGSAFLEQPSESFGFVGAGSDEEFDALDFALGVRMDLQNWSSTRFFPQSAEPPQWLYFTLTLDSALALAAHSGLNSDVSVLGSAVTSSVYRIPWTSGSGWGAVEEYLDFTQLGIAASATVDALCVYHPSESVIFSTAPDQAPSQLMVRGRPSTSATFTVGPLTDNGVRVTTKLGLRDNPSADEVDDIKLGCVIEPEGDWNSIGLLLGTPRYELTYPGLVGQPMGLSLTRTRGSMPGEDLLVIEVTGFGQSVPVKGPLVLLVSFNFQSPTSPNGPWAAPFHVSVPIERSPEQDSIVETLTIAAGTPSGSYGFAAVQTTDLGSGIEIVATSTVCQIDPEN